MSAPAAPLRRRYVYAVLRFVPVPARGEYVNIGTVVVRDGEPARFDMVSDYSRAEALDDQGVLPHVLDFLRDARAEVTGEAALYARYHHWCNLLQLSEPLPVVAAPIPSLQGQGVRGGESRAPVMSPPASYIAHDGTVRRWLYPPDKPRPHGSGCYDCGLPYGRGPFGDLIIPDEAWALISPRGGEGGLLCPNCIFERLAAIRHGPIEAGAIVSPVAVETGEDVPSPVSRPVASTPGGAARAVALLGPALVAQVAGGGGDAVEAACRRRGGVRMSAPAAPPRVTHGDGPPVAACRRCGAEMASGIALTNTVRAGAPDFPGDTVASPGQTLSYTGPPVLVPVTKCPACGHSHLPREVRG